MNTDTDFHPHLHSPEFSQIPDSQNKNKAQGKDLRLIPQHSDSQLLNFDRVCHLRARLQRLTLPYLDPSGVGIWLYLEELIGVTALISRR